MTSTKNRLVDENTCYKVEYARPKNCMVAIQRILASGRIITRIGFYKCPRCGGWHITHNATELKGESLNVQR